MAINEDIIRFLFYNTYNNKKGMNRHTCCVCTYVLRSCISKKLKCSSCMLNTSNRYAIICEHVALSLNAIKIGMLALYILSLKEARSDVYIADKLTACVEFTSHKFKRKCNPILNTKYLL